MSYQFTIDDDELNDEPTSEKGVMCDFFKVKLPPSASILSRQIAKAQAKRAERDERRRRRLDLSTVREQDESRNSTSQENLMLSPVPKPEKEEKDDVENTVRGGRSRIDAAPLEVKLKRQASLPDEERRTEPVDDEEAELLAMLLSGCDLQDGNSVFKDLDTSRKFSLPAYFGQGTTAPVPVQQVLSSPGLPHTLPSAKVSEWLLERSASPDALSIGTASIVLEDSGLADIGVYDEDDEFFDAEEESEETTDQNRPPAPQTVPAASPEGPELKEEAVGVVMLSHEGMSLNRNMAAMTQSLVRVEEETTTDGGMRHLEAQRNARSTSVSPRPTESEFVRGSPVSATFNVKHSSTMKRVHIPTISNVQNGNVPSLNNMTSTPLSSRTARSVLRVHNVNAMSLQRPSRQLVMPKPATTRNVMNARQTSVTRKPQDEPTSRPSSTASNNEVAPPKLAVQPSTPSRSASVASSHTSTTKQQTTFGGLQDLISMQEEALRRAVLDKKDGRNEELERKLSWHSDHEPMIQSSSTHSSLGSLTSSRSMDGAGTMHKSNHPALVSRIPTPRSRLPTPRGSAFPKRVQSVAAAIRATTPKPQSPGGGGVNGYTSQVAGAVGTEADECF